MGFFKDLDIQGFRMHPQNVSDPSIVGVKKGKEICIGKISSENHNAGCTYTGICTFPPPTVGMTGLPFPEERMDSDFSYLKKKRVRI